MKTLRNSKTNVDIIDLKTGKRQINTRTKYDYGFDRAYFVQLKQRTNKYMVCPNVTPANHILLISDNTIVMNQLQLYERVKIVNARDIFNTTFQFVDGVPGCGKTSFIMQNLQNDDLALFPTWDAVVDFRTRQTGNLSLVQPGRRLLQDSALLYN